jgi:hypothetical protein
VEKGNVLRKSNPIDVLFRFQSTNNDMQSSTSIKKYKGVDNNDDGMNNVSMLGHSETESRPHVRRGTPRYPISSTQSSSDSLYPDNH